MQKLISSRYAWMLRNYTPDLTPRSTTHLPGRQRMHTENTRNSRYDWLPIHWQGDSPFLRWYDEWRVEDFLDLEQKS